MAEPLADHVNGHLAQQQRRGGSHVIAGRTLAAILTAEKYSDRLLGGNKLISVVNRFTQIALGNNVEVGAT